MGFESSALRVIGIPEDATPAEKIILRAVQFLLDSYPDRYTVEDVSPAGQSGLNPDTG